MMRLLPSLVEGWPFPWSCSVVHHPVWETPAGVRVGPSLWRGSLKLPVVAMQARSPVLLGKEKQYSQDSLTNDLSATPHHKVADIVLPVCVAFLWSWQITIVGAISDVERMDGVVMPVLDLKLHLFTIPNSQQLAMPLWDTFVRDMVDCSVTPVKTTKLRTTLWTGINGNYITVQRKLFRSILRFIRASRVVLFSFSVRVKPA